MSEPGAIATPCRKICVIDPVTSLCEGCGRTLNEIARWMSMTPTERNAVMRELPARLQQFAHGQTPRNDGPR